MKSTLNVLKKILFLSILLTISCSKPNLINNKVYETFPLIYTSTKHLIIDVTIEGKNYPFLIDSAAGTVIFDNLIETYTPELITQRKIYGINGKPIPSKVVLIKHLAIGNIQFEEVIANHVGRLPITCSENIYGILGRDIMRFLIWQFDFQKGKITVVLDKEQLIIPHNSFKIPIKKHPKNFVLSVDTTLDSIALPNIIIDTGSNAYLSTSFNSLIELNYKQGNIKGMGSIGLGGASYRKSAFSNIDNFCLQDLCIQSISTDISENSLDLLGLGFFKNYLTTINWKDQELILSPYEKQNFYYEGFGIKPVFDKTIGKLLIKSIVENSIAEHVGLTLGDTIISINKVKMQDQRSFCNLNYTSLDSLNMEVYKYGKLNDFVLKKHPY